MRKDKTVREITDNVMRKATAKPNHGSFVAYYLPLVRVSYTNNVLVNINIFSVVLYENLASTHLFTIEIIVKSLFSLPQ